MADKGASVSAAKMAERMKGFSIAGPPSSSKKNLSKKEQEDQRKKEEEVAAAAAYEEFLAAFDEPSKHGKTFVRGTTFNAGTREEKLSKDTGKLYRPPKLMETPLTPPPLPTPQPKKEEPRKEERVDKLDIALQNKKKEKEKKKSNLELFKEELRVIQEEREERHRLKSQLKDPSNRSTVVKYDQSDNSGSNLKDEFRSSSYGSYDTGDPTTTNLYLGNLNPKMTEQQLCEIFGKYGPLASVKIMWPRSEEEKARGRNCGFVAFMNRKDGERSLKALNGKEIMNYEMKLGWGKAVPIPPHPVYIPPALVEMTLPPPPSGLPFNAQPDRRDRHKLPLPMCGFTSDPDEQEELDKILANAVVKVVIPTERNLLCLIHRMIEFVVREGPLFEAMIMNRELNNPMFRFLFENQSPAHVYYRWKLYSILQGESPSKWRTQEFRMFKGGSIWRPPPLNPYLQGMPEELVEKPEEPPIPRKGQLSNSQRDRLEDMLRNLVPERTKIGEAMVYCIEHAEAAEEIVECIAESLSIIQTPLHKKIARLFLVSDILHNCSVKVANASFFRRGFQSRLPDVFKDVHDAHQAIEGRLKAEQFKQKVMSLFRTWEDWAIYPNEFLIKLQNVFLGLVASAALAAKSLKSHIPLTFQPKEEEEMEEPDTTEVDGVPLTDVDGIAMDDLEGTPLVETTDIDGIPMNEERDDLDGVPLPDEELDGMPLESELEPSQPKYAPSKWETVDPEVIEAQAMTTSKWDLLDQQEEEEGEIMGQEEDLDGKPMEEDVPSAADEGTAEEQSEREDRERDREMYEALKLDMSEERRAKLRDIELKVMKFQDELESGKRSKKSGMTIAQQVELHRHKLLRKEREREEKERELQEMREPVSPDDSGSRDRHSRHSGSPSPRHARSRSHSPKLPAVRTRSKSPRRLGKDHSPRRKSHRSRSRSPKRSRRSRSRSPHKRRTSVSPSPVRKSHKKKSKH